MEPVAWLLILNGSYISRETAASYVGDAGHEKIVPLKEGME